ncbi:MAG: protein-L-isoaspartate O-methyltransferase [Candidatus Dojkabacteria bacterium]|nr:MAG: protein-L-isoaspartate O-methyltransferase [Candidatus Dojkabacteria bacterium]
MIKMPAINLDDYGGANAFSWTHEYLQNYLTNGKHRIIKRPLLKNAFSQIHRSDFVLKEFEAFSNEDRELDIGYGEVINKPTVIAEILELLSIKLGGKYLDIGTGSGYVAALLGMSVGDDGIVYSLERIQFLADIARINLSKYPDLQNVKILFRDGSNGFSDYAPYDGIHIATAFDEVPKSILVQLKIGGKLVMPTTFNDIRLYERIGEDDFEETVIEGYKFDPMQKGVE